MTLNKLRLWLGGTVLLLSACTEPTPGTQNPDTPVSGHIKVSIDESLKPLGDAEVKTFMQLYTKTTLDATYTSEAEALKDMWNDTARMIIIPRTLTEAEQKMYTDKKHGVKIVKIAYDAIALIRNKKYSDTVMTMATLDSIMNGKIQLKGKFAHFQLVFDNPGSSTLEYMKAKFHVAAGQQLPDYFSAVHTNQEVINYVEQNPNALGVIGVSWIANDDSMPNAFMKRVKVVSLNPPDTAKGTEQSYYPPFQAWIKTKYYPLTREVYAITPEFFNGLGSGFIDFIASDKGQLRAYYTGLVPATMQTRLMQSKKEVLPQ